MGHWAELDENNIVLRVIVITEKELDTGNWGDKSKWVKTSYNTRGGIHYVPDSNWSKKSEDQSKAIGYRYAGIGMKYDKDADVFYQPEHRFSSFIFSKALWEAPENFLETPSNWAKIFV